MAIEEVATALDTAVTEIFAAITALQEGFTMALETAVAEATDREPQIFEGRRREISSVGIVTGAAEREYHQAVAAGLDAYITGEATERR